MPNPMVDAPIFINIGTIIIKTKLKVVKATPVYERKNTPL